MTDDVLPSPRHDRGCEYCADDQNMFYGHVEQVSSSEDLGTLLLRCPQCGCLYETRPAGLPEAQPLSAQEARDRYNFS